MKKDKKRGAEAVSAKAARQAEHAGCQRSLPAQTPEGISRSLGTAEKDPTVHPESPRNNPGPG